MFANRIFHQKYNKSDKMNPTPLNDNWTRPTYNSGRVNQYTMGKTVTPPVIIIVDFANSVDPVEAVHDEPPHLDRKCLPSFL